MLRTQPTGAAKSGVIPVLSRNCDALFPGPEPPVQSEPGRLTGR